MVYAVILVFHNFHLSGEKNVHMYNYILEHPLEVHMYLLFKLSF